MTQGGDAAARRPASRLAHVHVRIGACDVAIAVDQVIQAVPRPPAGLARLPRREGGLLGLLEFEHAVVPVVSLERWVPMGEVDQPSQARIVVLRDKDAVVGIEVDAVLGVKAIEADTIRRVHHGDSAAELFESIAIATQSNPLLSILEVRRLMTLCDTWCRDAGVPKGGAGAEAPAKEAVPTRTRHAVFSMGGDWWAIPAVAIERVAPAPLPELEMRRGTKRIGICQWEGRKLPLVDISDPGRATHERAPWMVVVEHEGLILGLAAQGCEQLIDIGDADLTLRCEDEVQAGIALWPQLGKVRVLNVAKLFATTPEAGIQNASVATAGTRAADAAFPYIVFETDRAYAAHVQDIVGIVELPSATIGDLVAGKSAGMVWRGRAVNVVRMPVMTEGATAAAFTPHLAVLVDFRDGNETPLGIAIHRLTDWIPAHSVKCSSMRMGSVGQFDMITLPDAQQGASLVVVDFAQIAYLLG